MDIVRIETPFIKLDQLLKYADVTQNGTDAKFLIKNGYVSYNGEKEVRRGKKVYPGDKVRIVYEDADIKLLVE